MSKSQTEALVLASNLTTTAATTPQTPVAGGKYSVLTSGTPGTSVLQMLLGSAWVQVQALAAGASTIQLPPGQVRISAVNCTGMTVTLATVPT